MTEESVPQQGGSAAPAPPKGLLQQMEELMTALNADLSALEDHQAAGSSQRTEVGRVTATATGAGAGAGTASGAGAGVEEGDAG
ncbi:hypothetical protein ABZ464_48545 [Streptomyces sp. NPDC005820]|uniref:hypothetical protein n=1 Tax=Streptomyces sp. NPDC005820 TaxID=3157069 RepID=UPI0033EBDCAE